MNTEADLLGGGGRVDNGMRWSPANWKFDVLDATEAMSPHYEALSQSLAAQDDATWDAAIEEHVQALARVCCRLTEHARSRTGPFTQCDLPADFVVGIFEEREGEPTFSRWVRASIAPEILVTLPAPVWDVA